MSKLTMDFRSHPCREDCDCDGRRSLNRRWDIDVLIWLGFFLTAALLLWWGY